MAKTVLSFIETLRVTLQDADATRWSDNEIIAWMNLGQAEMVAIKPEVNTKVAPVQLNAGTRQNLPADGVQFFRLIRNMGVDGSTVGAVIRGVDYSALDTQSAAWHSMTPTDAVSEFAFRPSDPTHYYVYPPSTGAGFVDIEYGALPQDCASNGNVNVNDVWIPTLFNYVLYRAYAKEADDTFNASLAATYNSAFGQALGMKAQAEASRNQSQGA